MSALQPLDHTVCNQMWQHMASVVTHPRGHASGGKPSNVVFEVNASNPNYVHLICRVVQGPETGRRILVIYVQPK